MQGDGQSRQFFHTTHFWCSILNLLNGINFVIYGAQDYHGKPNYVLVMCGVSLAVCHLATLVKSEFRGKTGIGNPGCLLFRLVMFIIASAFSIAAFLMFGQASFNIRPWNQLDTFVFVTFIIGYIWFIINFVLLLLVSQGSFSVSFTYPRKSNDSYKVVDAKKKSKNNFDEEEGIYENGDIVVHSTI